MSDSKTYRFKSFLLNVGERQLFDGDLEVSLTPKTFDVLVHLVENAGRLVHKDDLMKAVWPDSYVEEVNIPRSVHHLRKMLRQDDNGNRFIETVPTKGYRFVAPVEKADVYHILGPTLLDKTGDRTIEVAPDSIQDGNNKIEELPSRPFAIKWVAAAGLFLGIAILLIFWWSSLVKQADSVQAGAADDANTINVGPTKLYWERTGVEQVEFIRERSEYVQTLIGDSPADPDERFVRSIKVELDDFASRNESVSDRPFRESINAVYGRAANNAEEVADYFEGAQLSGALGIYQAMVESEYHQCLISPTGSVGLFQITKRNTKLYDLDPDGYCHIGRNSEAASRYMGDIGHELATGRVNGTLSLFAHNVGPTLTQEYLRELRRMRIWERSAWAILRNKASFSKPVPDSAERYLARFFAAAIIGETPSAFDLSTPPLSTIRTPRTANN